LEDQDSGPRFRTKIKGEKKPPQKNLAQEERILIFFPTLSPNLVSSQFKLLCHCTTAYFYGEKSREIT